MTWRALNASTRNSGAPSIDYAGFDARYQQEETLPPEQQLLHSLVDRYDSHGLVIKTQSGAEGEQQQVHKEREGNIAKMARHAMKSS